jgi:hypothetical protein
MTRHYVTRLAILIVLTFTFQPQMSWLTLVNNLVYIRMNTGAGATPATFAKTRVAISNSLPPALGYNSLYDDTYFNARFTQILDPYVVALFLGLTILGAVGFLRRMPSGAGEGWATLTVALAVIAVLAAAHENYLFLIRSAQMAIPNIVLGLSLLTFARRGFFRTRTGSVTQTSLTMAGRILAGAVWLAFLTLNGFAVARTVDYVNRHSQGTDLRVHHFDPDKPIWNELRSIAGRDGETPVLISGFTDTPTTHMIAHGLRSIPHLLGRSITTFWAGADPAVSLSRTFYERRHWLTEDELQARLKTDPVSNWAPEYDRLLKRTRLALVPPSGTYPTEWGEWPSLFGARGWRFANLRDVLERDSPAFIADAEAEASGRDETGPYWILKTEAKAHPNLPEKAPAIIEVRYEGPAPQILVDGVALNGQPRTGSGNKTIMILSAAVDIGREAMISISAGANTRLRSVELYNLPADRTADR